MTSQLTPRDYRFLAGIPAVLHLGETGHDCRAHNLTRSGVLVVGRFAARPGPVARVTLTSAKGDLTLTLDCRVAHVAEDRDAGEVLVGMEFGTVGESNRPLLESLISRVVEGVAPAPLQNLARDASAAEVRRALEQVPLAHKVTLAARATPREREVLLHDTQLQVIDALARNPTLLPQELRMILRRPHLLPHTLESIARDGRWRGNEHLMVIVATHPGASLALSDRLISTMSREGMSRALQAPGLKPALRAKLVRNTSRRPGRR